MKVLVFAAVLAAAASTISSSYLSAPASKPAASYHQQPKYQEEASPYAYHYSVNDHYTGTNFAKNEQSDGHTTKGSYTVVLPDGRIQTVKYVADDYNGFNAEVTYQGKAHYPKYQPGPAYKSASVSYTSGQASEHIRVH